LVELDHMDPKSKGGWDHPDSLVACCKKCNSKKKDRLFVEWLELLSDKRRQLARAVYVAKHSYQPEDFIPKPSVITFGYLDSEETPKSLRFNAMLQELEKKKAQGTLTLPDVANALRLYHEMEDKLPPSPPRETRQLPDENGCFWACDWYSPDDISDEEWWCKERWYAYCEINSAPPDKGDRGIQSPNQ
jgi:hypothetical protein